MIVNKNKLTLDPSMNDQKWMNMVLNDEMYKVLNGPTLNNSFIYKLIINTFYINLSVRYSVTSSIVKVYQVEGEVGDRCYVLLIVFSTCTSNAHQDTFKQAETESRSYKVHYIWIRFLSLLRDKLCQPLMELLCFLTGPTESREYDGRKGSFFHLYHALIIRSLFCFFMGLVDLRYVLVHVGWSIRMHDTNV